MQIKFLHAADIHLGYQQYGLEEALRRFQSMPFAMGR